MDFDGVITDNRVWTDQDGRESVASNRSDSYGLMLLRNAGRVLTRGQLIDEIWGSDYVGDTKTLDVHIRRLRSRIEADPGQPTRIQTVRGVGYRFADT